LHRRSANAELRGQMPFAWQALSSDKLSCPYSILNLSDDRDTAGKLSHC
jgi:hypothetical protein